MSELELMFSRPLYKISMPEYYTYSECKKSCMSLILTFMRHMKISKNSNGKVI